MKQYIFLIGNSSKNRIKSITPHERSQIEKKVCNYFFGGVEVSSSLTNATELKNETEIGTTNLVIKIKSDIANPQGFVIELSKKYYVFGNLKISDSLNMYGSSEIGRDYRRRME